MRNLFDDLPTELPEELIDTLAASEHVRVERIVSTGHASPPDFWYDQPQREWVVLLAGEARLRFEDDESTLSLNPGDWVDIQARRRHRVEWTAPNTATVWLAIHFSE